MYQLISILTLAASTSLAFVIYPEAQVFAQTDVNLQPQPLPLTTVNDGLPHREDDSSDQPLPVVIWHGLGDSADADGLKGIADLVDEINPGTYVHIISLADGSADRSQSWFGNVNDQIDLVCDQLAKDPILSTAPAIDAIGFSQGGQFLRGYIERCGKESPRIRSLVTFGSQHNGIAEFQKCSGVTDFLCNSANALLRSSAVWSNFVQSRLVPAQYYRDTKDFDNYLNYSNFLADINNEKPAKKQRYADNLAQLEKFVMIIFEDDATVIPKESGWFAEVDPDTEEIIPLRQRAVYKEDWLGLKKLDQKGGLVFESVKGTHMELHDKDLKRLFKTYFGPVNASSEQESEVDRQSEL